MQRKRTIRDESLTFLGDGGASLMYRPEEILSVRCMKQELEPGKDYTVSGSTLYRSSGGNAPYIPLEEYYPDKFEEGKTFYHAGEHSYILFRNDDYFYRHQIYVTYTTYDAWEGPEVPDKSHLLPRSTKNPNLHLVALGDSITCGGNTSGMFYADGAPIWLDEVAEALHVKTKKNLAKGGESSIWAVDNFSNFDLLPCDLMIIAFGMNDGSGGVKPEEYQKNIRFLIEGTKQQAPEAEFLLIATMLPDERVQLAPGKSFLGFQKDYLGPLLELEQEGIAVADMTSIHEYLLTKKRFVDMTGNNVNHQNDFLSHVYTQTILKTLGVIE